MERDHFRDLGVNGKIIFGSTLKKYGVNTIKYLRRGK
jgi:hypothetical protein